MKVKCHNHFWCILTIEWLLKKFCCFQILDFLLGISYCCNFSCNFSCVFSAPVSKYCCSLFCRINLKVVLNFVAIAVIFQSYHKRRLNQLVFSPNILASCKVAPFMLVLASRLRSLRTSLRGRP